MSLIVLRNASIKLVQQQHQIQQQCATYSSKHLPVRALSTFLSNCSTPLTCPPTAAMTRTATTTSSLQAPIYKQESCSFSTSSLQSSLNKDVEMIAANNRQNNSIKNKLINPAAIKPINRSFGSAATAMKDEYGVMDDSGNTFVYPDSNGFVLESGQVLPKAQLRYQTYGELNEARDNVIVVCHALTGNASLHSWWGDLLGPNKAFDTNKYLVVCCNILGSCYGSTSPTSIDPQTNQMYGVNFPDVSVKDTVRLQLCMIQQELQAKNIKCVIGGSFGGMQAIEFAVQGTSEFCEAGSGEPYVKSVVPIACGASHTAWQIAISEVQRQAIYHDPQWLAGNHFEAKHGLQVARQLGMISYRTPKGYQQKFGRKMQSTESNALVYGSTASWQVKSYLQYQGLKFLSRFDPVTYVKMTEQMDSHDVSRGRNGSCSDILKRVNIPALVLGIDSDVLYPVSEQEFLASSLPQGRLEIIHSDDGHDGFLLEQIQVAQHITDFLATL